MKKSEIINRIIELRKEKFGDVYGAVKEFAKFIGINYTTYRSCEEGSLGADVLIALHDKYDTKKINWLLTGEEPEITANVTEDGATYGLGDLETYFPLSKTEKIYLPRLTEIIRTGDEETVNFLLGNIDTFARKIELEKRFVRQKPKKKQSEP